MASFLLCLCLAPSVQAKADWKSYDFGCPGLSIELPFPLKKVVKTIKTPTGRLVKTVNFQGEAGGVSVNVFLTVNPSQKLLDGLDDAMAANEQMAQLMAGILKPEVKRYHESRGGFDSYAAYMRPSTAKQTAFAASYMGKRKEVIVAIALAAKPVTQTSAETVMRVVNSVAWKPAAKK